MADLATKLEGARAKVKAKDAKFLPDLCNLIIPGTSTPDGFGGETSTPTTHLNIRCKVEVLSANDRVLGGAQITTQDHKITMGVSAITKQIKPHYQIVVLAHHDQVERTFHLPVAMLGSFDVFMRVAATLKV